MSVVRALASFLAPFLVLAVMAAHGAESPETCGTKTVVGPTVYARVKESNLLYLARIDSDSNTVSLRAWDLVFDKPAKKPEDNIGKMVRFRTSNEKGVEATARARIVDSVQVNSADGSSQRYVIELTVTYAGRQKVVHANFKRSQSYDLSFDIRQELAVR